uniref:Uncharacterized protein n=1 Tax=Bubo bubo TaxID=30461 RepID=A0A8C0IE79_BUBBB
MPNQRRNRSCACCFPIKKVTAKFVTDSAAEAAKFRYLKPPSVIGMRCSSSIYSRVMRNPSWETLEGMVFPWPGLDWLVLKPS